MEFLDEYESRPRFLFQSKNLSRSDEPLPPPSSSLYNPSLLISVSFSLLICTLALLYFNSEPLKSLLLWISISLLLGPFAPQSITAGDIRVGVGPPVKEIPIAPTEINERPSRKSTRSTKKAPEDAFRHTEKPIVTIDASQSHVNSVKKKSDGSSMEEKSEEWSEADDEMLKKLLVKHPVGKPGRWEAIAEGLKGRHKVETVIAKAKRIGEKKGGDEDSYKKFLMDRKPLDKRSVEEEGKGDGFEQNAESGWSSSEDLALLNALKAFPKDVPMRWEKVASALPGKTKAACVKRVAELKKDFRSSKAGQA